MTTSERIAAGLGIIRAVLDTVKEVRRAPRGPLYSTMQSKGATFDQCQQVEQLCLRTGLVRVESDCLVWIGPQA